MGRYAKGMRGGEPNGQNTGEEIEADVNDQKNMSGSEQNNVPPVGVGGGRRRSRRSKRSRKSRSRKSRGYKKSMKSRKN